MQRDNIIYFENVRCSTEFCMVWKVKIHQVSQVVEQNKNYAKILNFLQMNT